MAAEELSRQLEGVWAAVADVRHQLLEPRSLRQEETLQKLTTAIRTIECVQETLRENGLSAAARDSLRLQIQMTAREISIAAYLAQGLERHTSAWLQWLAMHFRGYSMDGEVASLPVSGRIELHG